MPIWAVFTPDDSDLPNGRVRALAFAADGVLWAGTDGGLVRLDRDGGWQVYDRADSDGGLPSDIVSAWASGDDGALWVGTDRGLTRRDRDGHWRTYGKAGAGVGAGFGGALSAEIMHPIPLVAQTPVRIEERSRRTDDGAGGVIEKKINFPVWFEPKSAGGTPMRAAMMAARDVIEEWCRAHPNSFPPTILHVTDGEYTGASPEDAAKTLRQCHTSDGAALLFNLHISTGGGREIVFPKTERTLYDEYSRLLFRMSSILPPHYQELARGKGYEISDGSRGFIFNGNAGLIVDFFDIGTRPRLTSER